MGVIRFSLEGVQRFTERITPALNTVVIFFLILFVGFLVGKIAGRLIRTLLRDVKADGIATHAFGKRVMVARTTGTMVSYAIYLVTLVIALNAVSLTTITIRIILAIIVLALLISLFVALKNLIPNFVSWFVLRKKIVPGKYLKTSKFEGQVIDIGIMETTIEIGGGGFLLIPNSLLTKEKIMIHKKMKGQTQKLDLIKNHTQQSKKSQTNFKSSRTKKNR